MLISPKFLVIDLEHQLIQKLKANIWILKA